MRATPIREVESVRARIGLGTTRAAWCFGIILLAQFLAAVAFIGTAPIVVGFVGLVIILATPIQLAALRTMHREIEISETEVIFYRKGLEDWRIDWTEVEKIRSRQEEMQLLDRKGRIYRVPTGFITAKQRLRIRSFIPAGIPTAPIETVVWQDRPVKRKRVGLGIGVVLIAGSIIKMSGSSFDPASFSALIVGLFLFFVNLSESPTNSESLSPEPELRTLIATGMGGGLGTRTCVWVGTRTTEPNRRLLLLLGALLPLGLPFAIYEAIRDPGPLRYVEVILHLVAISLIWPAILGLSRVIPTTGWKVLTLGSQIEAIKDGKVYPVSITCPLRYLVVTIDGKKRLLLPQDFRLQEEPDSLGITSPNSVSK